METQLYFFHSSTGSQRLRLALSFKQVPYKTHSLDYWDDETFFELGVARRVPVLCLSDGRVLQDSAEILWQIDELFPDTAPLVNGLIDEPAWHALLDWRQSVEVTLQRLYAPILMAYEDIGGNEESAAAYKRSVQKRFGLTVEALANDRYANFSELQSRSRLPALAKHLAANQYYMGRFSIADCLLAADLFPLQIMDGINLPIDLLYYLQRVENTAGANLRDGMLVEV